MGGRNECDGDAPALTAPVAHQHAGVVLQKERNCPRLVVRYTSSVNWRHRIAVVVLMCLAALPLAGTICAMTCLSGTTAGAAHQQDGHQKGQDCEMSPAASAESDESAAKIGAFSALHCGTHDAALPQVAATDVRRADHTVMAVPATADPVDPLFGRVETFDSLQYTPPPDSAPPTATPLVLRV